MHFHSVQPIRGLLRLIAEISMDGVPIVLIGAREQAIMLIGIVLAIVIILVRVGRVILRLAEKGGRSDGSRRQTHDQQVEEADKTHQDGDRRVHRILRIEQKQGHKDHKEALAVEKAEELEVLEHALPLELRDEQKPGERNQVEGQDVEEGVRRRVLLAKVGEADHGCGAKAEDYEEVEDVSDVVETGTIHLLIILICHHINI